MMENDLWACHDAADGNWPCPEYKTREAAIEAGRAQFDHDFYIGKKEDWWPSADAMSVIEGMEYAAYEFADEYAEDWLSHIRYDSPETADLQDRLQKVIDQWIKDHHLEPTFFLIRETESIERKE